VGIGTAIIAGAAVVSAIASVASAGNQRRQRVNQEEQQERQDELQVDAAEENVSEIGAQIEQRREVLRQELQDFDRETGQVLGTQAATIGASGGQLAGSALLVAQESADIRAEGQTRIQQQAEFDIDALSFEQRRQENVVDVIGGDEPTQPASGDEPTQSAAGAEPLFDVDAAGREERVMNRLGAR